MTTDYDELSANVLEDVRVQFCKNFTPTFHFPYLRSKRVLIKDECELIEHCITSTDKASKFLDIISQKGYAGFVQLCCALEYSGSNTSLLSLLNRKFAAALYQREGAVNQTRIKVLPKPGDIGAPVIPVYSTTNLTLL